MSAYRTSEQWQEPTPYEELGGGIVDPNRPDNESDLQPQLGSAKPPSNAEPHDRISRRGGLSFPEAPDSALDPYWGQTSGGLKSPEQQAINRRGRELVRRALAGLSLDDETQDRETTDSEDAAIERTVDTEGVSYDEARRRVLG